MLADRSFLIREELLVKQATLTLPPASRGKNEMTSLEVKATKQVENTCRVEKVIRRNKHFKILTSVIPIPILRYANDISVVCSALTNLRGPSRKNMEFRNKIFCKLLL